MEQFMNLLILIVALPIGLTVGGALFGFILLWLSGEW